MRWQRVVPVVAAASGAVYIEQDQGLKRSMYFWMHAFPIYAQYRFVQTCLPAAQQDSAYQRLHDRYANYVFDHIILHLKGFYIKIAQVGSTRADMLPEAYLTRAVALQDKVPAMPFESVRQILETSYGRPLEQVFERFDPEPLGVASIGQVHYAILRSTQRPVAVKVQDPQAEPFFRSDIETIQRFCEIAQPVHAPFMEEVKKQFMNEFDYRREAQHLHQIRKNLMASPFATRVVVPEPLMEYCTKDVLVMEYLSGVKLLDALNDHFQTVAASQGLSLTDLLKQQAKIDHERQSQGLPRSSGMTSSQSMLLNASLGVRRHLTNTGIAMYNWSWGWKTPKQYIACSRVLDIPKVLSELIQIHGYEMLVDGSFNGDPHPGNIFLLSDGRYGLIDYGQVKNLNVEQRRALCKLIVALADRNSEQIVEGMIQLGIRTKSMNPKVLEKLAIMFFDRDDLSITEGLNTQLYMEKLQAMDPIVQLPDDYVMAFRLSMLLRGLSYHLRYDHISHAQEWKNIALQVLGKDAPSGTSSTSI